MRESRYAGVIAVHEQRVLLVREHQPQWGGSYWNIPSGAVERHETPVAGAVRELAEETGVRVAEPDLRLFGTTSTTAGEAKSLAWNFTTQVTDPALAVADPDGLVVEAGWFPREDAVRALSQLPYRPLAEPVLAFLTGGTAAGVTHWMYATPEADPVTVGALRG